MSKSLSDRLAGLSADQMRKVLADLKPAAPVASAAPVVKGPTLGERLKDPEIFVVKRDHETQRGRKSDYLTLGELKMPDGTRYTMPWLRSPGKGQLSQILLAAWEAAEKAGL